MSSSQRDYVVSQEHTVPNGPPRFLTPANKLPAKPALPAVLREGLQALFPPVRAKDIPDKFLNLLQKLDAKPP